MFREAVLKNAASLTLCPPGYIKAAVNIYKPKLLLQCCN